MAHERSNDYELLYMIYQMDEYSLKLFVMKYKKYMLKLTYQFRAYAYIAQYRDDILAEGMKLLYQSIYAYRDDGVATFSTFYYTVFRNRLITFLYDYRHGLCYAHGVMIPLDKIVEDDNYLQDQIRNKNEEYEGVYYLELDAYERSLRKILRDLRPLEREIILLRVDGFTYNEIAKKLKIEMKKVDNTIRKARNIKV